MRAKGFEISMGRSHHAFLEGGLTSRPPFQLVGSNEFWSVVLTPFDQGGSKSEPPFGWGNPPAIHINGPCLHCTKSSNYVFLEPFARSEPKKSNPVSQGKDDASNNSNPRGFRKGVVNRDPLSIKASPTPHGRWRRRRCDEFSCQASPNLALALATTGLR